jgi:tetratricopeptide (TPR) repeat protein
MAQKFPLPRKNVTAKLSRFAQTAITVALLLNVWANPLLAADPFRSSQQRNIGNNTVAAFNAIFQQGNYQAAEKLVQDAVSKEPNEPLAYAIKASLAYTNQDWGTLDTYSEKTLDAAKRLIPTDPLRGNLYAAVGHFLEGGLILVRQGTVNGAPQALSRLRQVYEHFDRAEAVSKDDPELNLLKGYMDLMIAVNLPFASPQQAIQRLEKSGSPQYLVDRGIAIAYRDLKNYPQALEYVDRAIRSTSENPELHYLKAQIQRAQAQKQKNTQLMKEAVSNFDKALAKKSQLPQNLVKQIERERGNAQASIASLGK